MSGAAPISSACGHSGAQHRLGADASDVRYRSGRVSTHTPACSTLCMRSSCGMLCVPKRSAIGPLCATWRRGPPRHGGRNPRLAGRRQCSDGGEAAVGVPQEVSISRTSRRAAGLVRWSLQGLEGARVWRWCLQAEARQEDHKAVWDGGAQIVSTRRPSDPAGSYHTRRPSWGRMTSGAPKWTRCGDWLGCTAGRSTSRTGTVSLPPRHGGMEWTGMAWRIGGNSCCVVELHVRRR